MLAERDTKAYELKLLISSSRDAVIHLYNCQFSILHSVLMM